MPDAYQNNTAEHHSKKLIDARSVANRTSDDPGTLSALLERFSRAGRASDGANYLEGYVLKHPSIASRETRQGHLTGSVLLLDRYKRCLLTLHRKYGTWQQLGGHADGNFDLLGVASREGFEESGLDRFMIDPIPIDIDVHDAGCYTDAEVIGRHFDVCFAGFVEDEKTIVRTEESIDLKWVAREELPSLNATRRLSRLAEAATTSIFAADE